MKRVTCIFGSKLVLLAVVILTFSLLTFFPAQLYGQEKFEIAGKTYTQKEKKWFLESKGKLYEVNPRIITAKFKTYATATDKKAFYAEHGFTEVRTNKLGFVDLKVPEGANPVDFIKKLQEENLIESAEVNTFGEYVAVANPDDPRFKDQWYLPKINVSPNPTDCAWNTTTGSDDIIIAVLDSGTDIGHQDLIGNIWINPREDVDGDRAIVPAHPEHLDTDDINGVDEDNNGYSDDLCGWDFSNNNRNVRGPFYHGTHVAGIIGAMTNNKSGVAGVAGGWGNTGGCLIMALQVGDYGPDGSILDDAIIYAADNGAHIITMSLSIATSNAVDAALNYAYNTQGVFIDCAAGNDSGAVSYPATNTNVVAVSSLDKSDVISTFSNRGPEIELAAPGEEIWSTRLNNTYGEGDGTSYSSPQVAGVAGLILSCKPALTNIQVRTFLQNSAFDLGAAGRDNLYGFGRVDALEAIKAAGCVVICECRCSPAGASGGTNVAWIMLVPIIVGIVWRWKVKKNQK